MPRYIAPHPPRYNFSVNQVKNKYLVVTGLASIAWLVLDESAANDTFKAIVLPSGNRVELPVTSVLYNLTNGSMELLDSWEAPGIPDRSSEFQLLDKMASNLATGV